MLAGRNRKVAAFFIGTGVLSGMIYLRLYR